MVYLLIIKFFNVVVHLKKEEKEKMKKPLISNRKAINEGLADNSVCPDCHGFGDDIDGCWTCGKPTESGFDIFDLDYLISDTRCSDIIEINESLQDQIYHEELSRDFEALDHGYHYEDWSESKEDVIDSKINSSESVDNQNYRPITVQDCGCESNEEWLNQYWQDLEDEWIDM